MGGPSKETKRWYAEHGFDVFPADWGERSATGEGLSHDRMRQEPRVSLTKDGLPPYRGLLVWLQRTESDRQVVEAVEDFLVPYLALMPDPKRRILDSYFADRKTQEAVGEVLGVSHQAVSKQLRAAVRTLVRLIARDAARTATEATLLEENGYDDGARAWYVFARYWEERFGRPY